MANSPSAQASSKGRAGNFKKGIKRSYQLYIVMAIPILFFVVVKYLPMYGLQIAFKDYRPVDGIWGSEWVGFENLIRFVSYPNFWRIISNTLIINLYQLVIATPVSVFLALCFNTIKEGRFKKSVQMISYAPHFISVVVMCSIIIQVLSPRGGIVNTILGLIGIDPINFMGEPGMFSSIYVWSGVWQNAGWGTIIFLASLSAVDQQLHEAAITDGASKFQRVINIDLMSILPMVVTMIIMRTGQMLNLGFQKVYLLQNPLNLAASSVIQTYEYEVGIASNMPDFSYAASIGMFTSVINFILILIVNKISRKVNDTSLWWFDWNLLFSV